MQTAWRTYEHNAEKAGVIRENKEALLPICHIIQKAQIDITIDETGAFQSARALDKKEKNSTIIPATMKSASRTSGVAARPLSDYLEYMAPYSGKRYEDFVDQLTCWAESEHSHPKVRAVLRYIQGGTLLSDLAAAGIIQLNEDGTPAAEFNKCVVRWQVIGEEEGKAACYEDQTLFEHFIAYCNEQNQDCERALCQITGNVDIACDTHADGVHPLNYKAKLVCSVSNGFVYRGRFADARQAGSVGYTASQKAHYALRWVAVNHGVTMGGRIFLCWNPEGHKVPGMLFGLPSDKEGADFVDYKRSLLLSLGGYKKDLKESDDIVVAALEAATTGRLSVTYYNEIKAYDFLQRMENWYTTCCWDTRFNGVTSPPLKDIVTYAFGTQRERFVETDDRLLREHVQRLLYCVIEQRAVPTDIVRALAVKAGNLLVYAPGCREKLLVTACAVIRKYRNDLKEEWDLALDTSNTNRSYLFGRLLAVAEQVERTTYDYGENRETNAIRMQAVFAQRPLYGWRIIDEKLGPYFTRLYPALRSRYKDLIGEITGKLPGPDDPELGKALADTYLLGYYHQRAAMLKKSKNDTEETDNEPAEE